MPEEKQYHIITVSVYATTEDAEEVAGKIRNVQGVGKVTVERDTCDTGSIDASWVVGGVF